MYVKKIIQSLGPGLLFAGASVGVSHLVQSTRAGVEIGFWGIFIIIAIHFLRYPSFLVGPLYSLKTKKSLVEAYVERGKYNLYVLFFVILTSMFSIIAAISMLCSALFVNLFDFGEASLSKSILLLLFSFAFLMLGGLRALERFMKFIFVFVTLILLYLGTQVVPEVSLSFSIPEIDARKLAFLIAFIGWMPTGMDVTLMTSEWTLKKQNYSIDEFKSCYIMTCLLALFFVVFGMTASGLEFSAKTTIFVNQILSLITAPLPDLLYLPVGFALFLVLYSTLLTVMDGFPRVLTDCLHFHFENWKNAYSSILLFAGAVVLLLFFSSSLKQMIDFATSLGFYISPLFTYWNHKILFYGPTPLLVNSFWRGVSLINLFFFTGLFLYSFRF